LAKRKKTKIAEDCIACQNLEKKIEDLTRTLAKYKKQANKLRHRLAELENYARETDYLSKILENIEEVKEECKEGLEIADKVNDEEIVMVRPDGKVVTFKKPDTLSYKQLQKTGKK
jgi:nitrate/nitrite-specific signal transduction histidine kinase